MTEQVSTYSVKRQNHISGHEKLRIVLRYKAQTLDLAVTAIAVNNSN